MFTSTFFPAFNSTGWYLFDTTLDMFKIKIKMLLKFTYLFLVCYVAYVYVDVFAHVEVKARDCHQEPFVLLSTVFF